LVCVAAMAIITSWWYARKVTVERVRMTLLEMLREASALLTLGVVFMASTLMTMGVAYVIRIIVVRKIGVDAAGFYQAAWVLGGLYVGFIVQAMGADFYPRLTAAAKDNTECNRLVNEQAEVGLLMAGPGVLATLTFAPLVIRLFYSAEFGPTVEILRWICLGMLLRVASWPMGFILLAKGAGRIFFWSEFVANSAQVALVWFGVIYFGLNGTGMAFFALYVFYWFLIYAIVRSVSGFRWSAVNKRFGLVYGLLVSAVFGGWYFLPRSLVVVGGLVLTLLAGIHSLKRLCAMVPLARFPQPAQRLLIFLRLAPSPING